MYCRYVNYRMRGIGRGRRSIQRIMLSSGEISEVGGVRLVDNIDAHLLGDCNGRGGSSESSLQGI